MPDAGGGVPWRDQTVDVRGGVIAAQSLGSSDDTSILLIGAATWSRDWWARGFCELLVGAGFRVLRYDQRDTGASSMCQPGEPTYDGADLLDDAIAVLDAFDVGPAMVLGLSMGGGTAQALAVRSSERVRALVLVSTSPVDGVDRGLPGPTRPILETFSHAHAEPDWADEAAVVDWVIESERPYAGPAHFDEPAMRAVAACVWARTPTLAAAATNHFMVAEAGDAMDLGSLRVPTLVVHGSADPLFPLAHGQALAELLDAPLLVLDGVGHQAPPPSTWPRLVQHVAALRDRALGDRALGDRALGDRALRDECSPTPTAPRVRDRQSQNLRTGSRGASGR